MAIKDRLQKLRRDEKERRLELAGFQKNLERQEQLRKRRFELRYRALEKVASHQLYPILAGVQAGYLGHEMGQIVITRTGNPDKPEVTISLAWGETESGDILLGWRRGNLIKIIIDELGYQVYASTHRVARVSNLRPGWQTKIENAIIASLAKGQARWSEAWDRRTGPRRIKEPPL